MARQDSRLQPVIAKNGASFPAESLESGKYQVYGLEQLVEACQRLGLWPQALLRQTSQNWLQEQIQTRLRFRHRKLVNCLVLQYASHDSALRSRLVVGTPKHTALDGVFQLSHHLWVIAKSGVLTNRQNRGII